MALGGPQHALLARHLLQHTLKLPSTLPCLFRFCPFGLFRMLRSRKILFPMLRSRNNLNHDFRMNSSAAGRLCRFAIQLLPTESDGKLSVAINNLVQFVARKPASAQQSNPCCPTRYGVQWAEFNGAVDRTDRGDFFVSFHRSLISCTKSLFSISRPSNGLASPATSPGAVIISHLRPRACFP